MQKVQLNNLFLIKIAVTDLIIISKNICEYINSAPPVHLKCAVKLLSLVVVSITAQLFVLVMMFPPTDHPGDSGEQ